MKNQSNETAILVNNLYLKDGTAILLVSYGDVHVPEGAADLFGFMPKKESDVVTEIVESETDDVSVPERLDVTVTDESVY